MMKCSFCGVVGDWKFILRDSEITMKDGSDVILCDDCCNLYHDKDYLSLIRKIKKKMEVG